MLIGVRHAKNPPPRTLSIIDNEGQIPGNSIKPVCPCAFNREYLDVGVPNHRNKLSRKSPRLVLRARELPVGATLQESFRQRALHLIRGVAAKRGHLQER